MAMIRKKIDSQGRISIRNILHGTNIKPGDLVDIIADKNKIVLKSVKKDKSLKVVERVAGKWKERSDIATEILNMRKEEDREVPGFE